MDLFSKAPHKENPEKEGKEQQPAVNVKAFCKCPPFDSRIKCPGNDLLKEWMADLQNIEKRNNYFLHYNQTK